MTVINNLIAN